MSDGDSDFKEVVVDRLVVKTAITAEDGFIEELRQYSRTLFFAIAGLSISIVLISFVLVTFFWFTVLK